MKSENLIKLAGLKREPSPPDKADQAVEPLPIELLTFLPSMSADLYIGYFANRYGEQWMFTFDRATGVASLRGGGVDWRTAHVVRDGRVDGLILNPEEAAWLRACWSAVNASP